MTLSKLFLWVALLGMPVLGEAAITAADFKAGTQNSPIPSAAYTSAISIGDVLVCEVFYFGSSSPGTQTVSDTVNSGNWTLINYQLDSGSGSGIYLYWKVANATGTPTVSVSQSSAQYGELNLIRFTGFTGTPTVDSGLNLTFTAPTSTSVSYSPITSTVNNELLLMGFFSNSAQLTSTVTGWNNFNGSAGDFGTVLYYAVVPTSGTNNAFATTLLTTDPTQGVTAGLYGASGGSCSNSGYTSGGAIATPNGSSGSYVGETGGFVTPDCSTVNYWQPSVGHFGVN